MGAVVIGNNNCRSTHAVVGVRVINQFHFAVKPRGGGTFQCRLVRSIRIKFNNCGLPTAIFKIHDKVEDVLAGHHFRDDAEGNRWFFYLRLFF